MKFLFTGLLLVATAAGTAVAHGGAATIPVPPELAATAAPAVGATDLKFSEIFRLPIGPTGLEPSAKLLSLAGKKVRLVGYMASVELPIPGRLVMTPLPVSLGDEDESLSDDLPATAVFVHLSAVHAQSTVPNLRGLLQVVGTLELGAQDEPDGHVSSVRLRLDEPASSRLVQAGGRASTSPNHNH